MQCFRIEVRPIRPNKSVYFRVYLDLIDQLKMELTVCFSAGMGPFASSLTLFACSCLRHKVSHSQCAVDLT